MSCDDDKYRMIRYMRYDVTWSEVASINRRLFGCI